MKEGGRWRVGGSAFARDHRAFARTVQECRARNASRTVRGRRPMGHAFSRRRRLAAGAPAQRRPSAPPGAPGRIAGPCAPSGIGRAAAHRSGDVERGNGQHVTPPSREHTRPAGDQTHRDHENSDHAERACAAACRSPAPSRYLGIKDSIADLLPRRWQISCWRTRAGGENPRSQQGSRHEKGRTPFERPPAHHQPGGRAVTPARPALWGTGRWRPDVRGERRRP